MRDLIAKQTAALSVAGGGMALYNPEVLRGGSNQEVMDAERPNDETVSILKSILSVLNKSLVVHDEIASSIKRLTDNTSEPTAKRSMSLLSAPTAQSISILENMPTAAITDSSTTQVSEEKRESTQLAQKQITLLEGILAALGGKPEGKAKPAKDTKDNTTDMGGLLSSGIKKMIPKLLKGFLKVGLLGIITGLISGISDGIKEYAESGDIMKALTAGLGGFLEFLTFGLFNKEDVEKWLKGAVEIWDNLGTYVDEYLVQPFNSLVETVGKALDEYLVQPISSFVDTVGTLFNQYVMEPISGFLKSVTGVFTGITDSLVTFLNSFEIPKVSVTLPVVGEISAGPWKPFAGVAGAVSGATAAPSTPAAAASSASPATAAPSTPPATSGNAVATTSAANIEARDNLSTASAPVIISAPSTNVQNSQNVTIPQPVRNPDRSFTGYSNRNRVIA